MVVASIQRPSRRVLEWALINVLVITVTSTQVAHGQLLQSSDIEWDPQLGGIVVTYQLNQDVVSGELVSASMKLPGEFAGLGIERGCRIVVGSILRAAVDRTAALATAPQSIAYSYTGGTENAWIDVTTATRSALANGSLEVSFAVAARLEGYQREPTATISPSGCLLMIHQTGMSFGSTATDLERSATLAAGQDKPSKSTTVVHGVIRVWPNPTRGQTSIAFTLAQQEEVSLRVYDISGRLVLSRVLGLYSEGTHAVTWDGRDGRARPVSQGIYLVRLSSASFATTRKLVLVR